jgi:transposase
MIDGDELERSYKHHLSDYAEWEQRDHASNWMLIEDNLGENLSIDETMLQEDLVTILSNKAGHCKQGSVISIVRGTKAEDVIEVLMKIPEEARLAVKEVTMDLSSSMRAIVSTVFPNATIVLDCFHVLKRCHDAIEEVRLHLKRDAQVELRRQEREHRQTQKRRAQSRRRYRKKHPRKPGAIMRGRPPKRKNERFKAPTYSNGDTKLELLTRTKRALTQSREKWSDKTAERMKILFQEEPKLKEAYDIVNGLRSIFRSKTLDKEAAKVKLHDWYETATRCSLREIKSARDAINKKLLPLVAEYPVEA